MTKIKLVKKIKKINYQELMIKMKWNYVLCQRKQLNINITIKAEVKVLF